MNSGKSENKRHRPDMPNWFSKEHAKFFRKNITKEEVEDLIERKSGLLNECKNNGIDINTVNQVWYKSKRYSIQSKLKARTYEEIRDDIIREMSKYSPAYPTIQRTALDNPHLLVLDPADVHIGKLSSLMETSDEYNIAKAKKMVQEGVQELLKKATNFNIEKIVFVGGNDILHTDFLGRGTTKGTPQDTDGMWYDAYQAAKDLYIWCIEACLPVADVHFVFCPSNHDYQSGYMLADSIKTWFRLNENVTFDAGIQHRKYVKYGTNLIGFTHGDGAKENDLGDIMKTACRKAWSTSKFGYWYCHHLHHKMRNHGRKKLEKDFFEITVMRSNDTIVDDKVTVEYLRTPSGTDSWHHIKGYEYGIKAIEAFLHSPDGGQVGRFSHLF